MNQMLDTAALLIECSEQVKELEEQLKAAKEERDSINDELAGMMVENEMQSVNLKGRILYLSTTSNASYNKELEEDFFKALRRHKFGDIIRPTINSKTLTAAVIKEIMREDKNGNRALPKWAQRYLTVFEKTKVSMRKG